MLSIFICDDEHFWIAQLEKMILNYQMRSNWEIALAYKATSPQELLQYLQIHKPINGLYFLDIHFPSDINGLELASNIRHFDPHAALVFVTTQTELAVETFRLKLEALDFIVKDADNLEQEVSSCLSHLEQRFTELSMPDKSVVTFQYCGVLKTVPWQDIYCLCTSNSTHRVTVYTKAEVFDFYSTLRSIQEQLNEHFHRCCRNCIINLQHVREWNGDTKSVILNNDMSYECSVREWKNLAPYRK